MDQGEDWLLRPVMRQMCSYESLKSGVVGLSDIALMNEALDVELENQYRLRKTS